ncbi:MAG: iron-containing alcohol dehydrogenase family protein [Pseudomonadota bacterium]
MAIPESFVFRHATRRVIFGWGALTQVADIASGHGVRRAALVVDDFFRDGPVVERLKGLLARPLEVPPAIFFVPPREPDIGTVNACHAVLEVCDPDLVLAVGGGSTMDAAKVARIMLSNPGGVLAIAGFNAKHRPHRSLMVGVPTTAGTGSEVSEMAVITEPGSDLKLRYRSAELPNSIAILDPSLTVSMPPTVTAQCGFDAIARALEGYVSKGANLMTEPYSFNALALLAKWLPVAMTSPDHAEARSHCLIAAMQAAVACNSTQLGLAHAISAPLGAIYHVIHGLGNALALPAVTAFNEPAMGAKAQALARLLDADSAAEGISKLRHTLGLDASLDDFIDGGEGREAIARTAMKSGDLRTNPRSASLEEVRAVISAMRVKTAGGPVRLEL